MAKILAADIGGTNSRFARFEYDGETLALADSVWLKTTDAASFPDLLGMLAVSGLSLDIRDADICVFAVAGGVRRGVYADPPNIAFDIDLPPITQRFGLKRALLLNDFLAQAYATRTSVVKDAMPVLPGTPDETGAVAVLGAGTGLGKAAMVPDGKGGFVAMPSEGGHTSFPFQSEAEFDYFRFLREKTGHPYALADIVVAGRGLHYLHLYLTGEDLAPAEISARLAPGSETLRWMARFLARVCRDFTMEVFAVGGVYIAGGVAAKNPLLVTDPAFAEEFVLSPTYSGLLSRVPVSLNANEESGLWGAAFYGLMNL